MDILILVKPVAILIVTWATLAGIYRLTAGRVAEETAPGALRIAPHRGVAAAVLAGCLALSCTAIYAALVHDGGGGAWAVGLAFGFGALLMVSAFSPAHAVEWNADELEGPASNWPPPFGPGRARLPFRSLTAAGTDIWGSYFVEDAAGTRIRWSAFHGGFADLNEAVRSARPDLFDDAGEEQD